MWSTRMLVSALVIAILGLAGCKRGPQMAEVEGTVKLKGKPLEKVHVEFIPEVDGPRSIGMTDEQGRFTLNSDNGKYKGAVVGSHKVVLRDTSHISTEVRGRKAENVDLTKGRKSRISSQYIDPLQTPLKKTVTAGKNSFDLDL